MYTIGCTSRPVAPKFIHGDADSVVHDCPDCSWRVVPQLSRLLSPESRSELHYVDFEGEHAVTGHVADEVGTQPLQWHPFTVPCRIGPDAVIAVQV
jgi:hypothetical protein